MLKFVSSLRKILKQSACQKMFVSFCAMFIVKLMLCAVCFFMICLLNGTTVKQVGKNMSEIF